MTRPRINRDILLNLLRSKFNGSLPATITRPQLYAYIRAGEITESECRWIWNDDAHYHSRGVYTPTPNTNVVPRPQPTSRDIVASAGQSAPTAAPLAALVPSNSQSSIDSNLHLAIHNGAGVNSTVFIPTVRDEYVPFGVYDDLRTIIKSRNFCPVWITGLSGNGKTETVRQICAELKREYFRVNITADTDDFDLLGGMHLENGNTVFRYGPVVEAMRRGAILLLDEVDLGTSKLLCLQSVLEGNPIYIKKTNEMIFPAAGFNIIATANTKGQGDITGKFLGTGNMNEAMLERFPITLEQSYPSPAVEKKILRGALGKLKASHGQNMETNDLEFVDNLCKWAAQIRESYNSGAITDVITTRRLIWAVSNYHTFGNDRLKAVRLVCSRFVAQTSESFVNLYSKMDDSVTLNPATPAVSDPVPVVPVFSI